MTSPTDLSVDRNLTLLQDLQRTIAEYAKREEQLTRDLRNRRTAAERQQHDALTQFETASTEELEGLEKFYRDEEERIRRVHTQRGLRIQRVHTKGVRSAISGAQRSKDKLLAELQMKHLQTERALPANLKAVDNEYVDFTTQLSEHRSRLGSLLNAARGALGGYPRFVRLLKPEAPATEEGVPNPTEREQWFSSLTAQLDAAEQNLSVFREQPLPRIFGMLPMPILLPMLLVIGGVGIWAVSSNQTLLIVVGAIVAALILGAVILYSAGGKKAEPSATALAEALNQASKTRDACIAVAKSRHEADRERITEDYNRICRELQEQWDQAEEMEMDVARAARQGLEAKMPRATARNERLLRLKLSKLPGVRTERLTQARQLVEQKRQELQAAQTQLQAHWTAEESKRFTELEEAWRKDLGTIFSAMDAVRSTPAALFPEWSPGYVEGWVPPTTFADAVRFGRLEVDLAATGALLPKRLSLPGPAQFSLPLSLTLPRQGSLLFETRDSGDPTVSGTLNNVILRLLATTPPGKITFTIIDPVGLGQNFAGLMHLSDYEETLINRRIWTQRDQIEERLEELNEHIEKVIQMYLRTEFATISEYNAQAGSVAEKIHFLVVADFPSTFTESAVKRLQSIALSGPRCGVFTLIHWDQRQAPPDGFVSDELRKNAVCIRKDAATFTLAPELPAGTQLTFDAPPETAMATELVHKIGKSSIDSNRVEVPFTHIAPPPEEFWKSETTNELRIPIGRTGATKLQYLAIGKGTRQHALFAGKTGSGKSTLFHVIITNLALACSPEQVEFYLIDFKKGVEFKCYGSKRLPHARVVAIESDREFGLSVLQRVDDELKRRGDMFRKLGVQDVAGYKRAGGTEPIPRSLLLIDEFQEFFVEDDEIAQNASVLFDRIVRQGRAFGIHVLLGSQTLGGAYTLARATLGQMVIRVALQCNEADAYLIMDENNSAPRLLSRPGEGIYNDAAGAVEGNSPFQVVWLPDDERDVWLNKVRQMAEERDPSAPGPIVFEGNAPAEIRENHPLDKALATKPTEAPAAGHAWLGAPNSIKGPTEAIFRRQSGNHLLIVGQREEASLSLLATSLVSLAAQYPKEKARFYFIHQTAPGSSDATFLEQVIAAIPHGVKVGLGNDLADLMSELATEFQARSSGDTGEEAPAVFLFIHGLQRFKKLRPEDEFSFSSSDSEGGSSPGATFTNLITEGSTFGMHLIAGIDTFNNVNRFLSRKSLSEIEMRVVFQMSANDSASLIDSPKASALGLHRAILYNEQQGSLETFRPYALPDAEWIQESAERLARIHG